MKTSEALLNIVLKATSTARIEPANFPLRSRRLIFGCVVLTWIFPSRQPLAFPATSKKQLETNMCGGVSKHLIVELKQSLVDYNGPAISTSSMI